eukprot:gene7141-248_t
MMGTAIDTSENRRGDEDRPQQSSSGNKHLARALSVPSSQATSTDHLSYDERQQVLHELMGDTAMDPKEFHKRLFMLREPEVAPGLDGKPVFTRHRWLADVLREEQQRMEDRIAFNTKNPIPLLDSDHSGRTVEATLSSRQSTGLSVQPLVTSQEAPPPVGAAPRASGRDGTAINHMDEHEAPMGSTARGITTMDSSSSSGGMITAQAQQTHSGCGSAGGGGVGGSAGSGPSALRTKISRSISALAGLAAPGSDRPTNWRHVLQSMSESSSESQVISSAHSLNSSMTSTTNFSQYANSNLTPYASSAGDTREVVDRNQSLDSITEASEQAVSEQVASERLLDSLERRVRAQAADLADVQARVEKKRAGNYIILFDACAVFDKMLRPPPILVGFSSSSSRPSQPVTSKPEAKPTASSRVKPEAMPRQTRGHANSQDKLKATPSQTRGHANSQVKSEDAPTAKSNPRPHRQPSQTRGHANSQVKSEAAPTAMSRVQLQRSASSISTSSNRLEQEINNNSTSNGLNQEVKVCWEQRFPDSNRAKSMTPIAPPPSLPTSTWAKSLALIALPLTQTSLPSILTSPTSIMPSSPDGGGGSGGEEPGPMSLWGNGWGLNQAQAAPAPGYTKRQGHTRSVSLTGSMQAQEQPPLRQAQATPAPGSTRGHGHTRSVSLTGSMQAQEQPPLRQAQATPAPGSTRGHGHTRSVSLTGSMQAQEQPPLRQAQATPAPGSTRGHGHATPAPGSTRGHGHTRSVSLTGSMQAQEQPPLRQAQATPAPGSTRGHGHASTGAAAATDPA